MAQLYLVQLTTLGDSHLTPLHWSHNLSLHITNTNTVGKGEVDGGGIWRWDVGRARCRLSEVEDDVKGG